MERGRRAGGAGGGVLARRRLALAGLMLALLVVLAGCGLWEPPRYPRLRAAAGVPVLRVFMVGNSLTYTNDLPGLLGQLSANEERPLAIESATVAAASLEYHWRSGAHKKLQAGNWDYVVLQDYSTNPVDKPEKTVKYFRLFDEEVRRRGGRSIIFQNWTRAGRVRDYEPMLATYRRVQEEIHAPLAPIGAAWRDCQQRRPDIKLRVDDRHPTAAGTYLAACVLYGVIYEKNPQELPLDLPGPKLPRERLEALREIAWRAVREERERHPVER